MSQSRIDRLTLQREHPEDAFVNAAKRLAADEALQALDAKGDTRDLFAEVTDTIRSAVRSPQDRRLSPENVQRACEYGLGEILGFFPR